LTYGKHVYPDQVHTEGITKITSADVEYAADWGGVVKLIGLVEKEDDGRLKILVCPMLLSRESQLANVDDVFNGILVRGDSTGDVVFYGKGAGKLPTASAVVADVIDCVKHFKARKYLFWSEGSPDYVEDFGEYRSAFYVRLEAEDPAAALRGAGELFGGIETLKRRDAGPGEAAFVTPALEEKKFAEKLGELSGTKILNTIRIADF
jgi:homoserine dehydrogenase